MTYFAQVLDFGCKINKNMEKTRNINKNQHVHFPTKTEIETIIQNKTGSEDALKNIF